MSRAVLQEPTVHGEPWLVIRDAPARPAAWTSSEQERIEAWMEGASIHPHATEAR
jgi:hypothetical protein